MRSIFFVEIRVMAMMGIVRRRKRKERRGRVEEEEEEGPGLSTVSDATVTEGVSGEEVGLLDLSICGACSQCM